METAASEVFEEMDGYPFRRHLGIAVVELGWTPMQFWRATVPEFWAACDWIAEKNLEIEERLDEAKAGRGRATVARRTFARRPRRATTT